MNIESKLFSDLLDELCDLKAALRIANLFLIHHSSNGNSAKLAQTVDTVRRLETQLSAVKLELDRRLPTAKDGYKGQTNDEGRDADLTGY